MRGTVGRKVGGKGTVFHEKCRKQKRGNVYGSHRAVEERTCRGVKIHVVISCDADSGMKYRVCDQVDKRCKQEVEKNKEQAGQKRFVPSVRQEAPRVGRKVTVINFFHCKNAS